jgi:hypothetical protein
MFYYEDYDKNQVILLKLFLIEEPQRRFTWELGKHISLHLLGDSYPILFILSFYETQNKVNRLILTLTSLSIIA